MSYSFKLFYQLLLFLFIGNVLLAQNALFIGDSGLNNLRRVDLDDNSADIIDDDINTPRGIAIDYDNGFVFYINGTDDSSIRKYDMNTGEITQIISSLNSPSRLALDELNKVIYFTQKNFNTIEKTNYVGVEPQEILDDVEGVNQIQFDHIAQKLFVINSDYDLYSMNIDGSDLQLINDELIHVSTIRLNPFTQKIYVSEKGDLNSISVMNYDGTGKTTILTTSGFPSHFDIDFLAEKIYFTIDQDGIWEANIDGSNIKKLNIPTNIVGFITLEQNYAYTTSSAKDIADGSDIQIYPNPASKSIQITTDDGKSIKTIDIISNDGKNVLQINNVNSSKIPVDIEQLPNGIYFLLAKFDTGTTKRYKFVKE